VLDPECDGAGLLHGHRPVPVLEAEGLVEMRSQAAGQLEVAVRGLLVGEHRR
jgi:hypothetical protein